MKRQTGINSRHAPSGGFTLIEIMIAIAVLSLGLVSLYTAQGNSLRASGNAERIQVAAMLARKIMTEKMLELEKGMKKGSFPDDKEEETGEFDPPFNQYRWEYSVRKVNIPIAGGEGGGGGEGASGGSKSNQAPESAQRSMAQIVSKKIGESIREVNVRIVWEELGEEQSIKVTSHVSKL